MRLAAAIVAFVLAAVGLLWAALYALAIAVWLYPRIGGGWSFAMQELSSELDLGRLAVAGCALGLGLAFLMTGVSLQRGGRPADGR